MMIWKALLVFLACLSMFGQAALGDTDPWQEIETQLSTVASEMIQSNVDDALKILEPLITTGSVLKWSQLQFMVNENVWKLEHLKKQNNLKDCSDKFLDFGMSLFDETKNYPNVNRLIKYYMSEISKNCRQHRLITFDNLAWKRGKGQTIFGEISFFTFQAIFLALGGENRRNPEEPFIEIMDYIRWASDRNIAEIMHDKFIREDYNLSTYVAAGAALEAIYLVALKRAAEEKNKKSSSRPGPSELTVPDRKTVDKMYWSLVDSCRQYTKKYDLFTRAERVAKIVGGKLFFWEGKPEHLGQYYLGWAAYRICDNLGNDKNLAKALHSKMDRLATRQRKVDAPESSRRNEGAQSK